MNPPFKNPNSDKEADAELDRMIAELDAGGLLPETPANLDDPVCSGLPEEVEPDAIDDDLAVVKRALEVAARLLTDSPDQVTKYFQDVSRKPHTAYRLHTPEGRLKRTALLGGHFAANQQGLIAPRFRRQSVERVTRNTGLTAAQQQVKRDEILEDIHWVLCRRIKSGLPRLEVYAGSLGTFLLIDDGQINWAEVVSYCRASRKPRFRVKDLGMTYNEQVQCVVLHSKKVSDRKRNIQSGTATVRSNIETWQQRARGPKADVGELIRRWEMLRFGDGSATSATRIEWWRTGVNLEMDTPDGQQQFKANRRAMNRALGYFKDHGVVFRPLSEEPEPK